MKWDVATSPRWERRSSRVYPFAVWRLLALTLFAIAFLPTSLPAKEKDTHDYGVGMIVNVPYPVAEVLQAVEDVAGSGIIRGTKEYIKDEYITGAVTANSTALFPAWTEPGKVFYKVRKQALNPWNFKDSNDMGTVAVRYVVQPQGNGNSIVRIDAVFVEDFRRTVHPSNGSVESSEYKDIWDHIEKAELLKKETVEALRQKQDYEARKNFGLSNTTELLSTPPGESSSRSNVSADSGPEVAAVRPATIDDSKPLDQQLGELRHEVERLVKKPGAPLKSAPFHTANTLKSLDPGTEVVVEILTPYWLGVETRDGQHGWLMRDQLESLP